MPQSRVSRAIQYFSLWGLLYGLIFGLIIGTIFFPLPLLQFCVCAGEQFRTLISAEFTSIADLQPMMVFAAFSGAVIGGLLGPLFGVLQGLLVGALISLFSRPVPPETDLDAYGVRLSRRLEYPLGFIYLAWIGALYLIRAKRLVLTGTDFEQHPALFLIVMSFLIVLAMIGLLMPMLAIRSYPRWISREQPMNSPESRMFAIRQDMETNFHVLRRGTQQGWVRVMAVVVGYGIVLTQPQIYTSVTSLLQWFGIFALTPVVALVCLWLLGVYLALFNAAILMYVKLACIERYFPKLSPSRTHITLTICAFVLTLGAVWWTFYLAPVCAAIMAYFVYHSFVLSDEKSKRKEKSHDSAIA